MSSPIERTSRAYLNGLVRLDTVPAQRTRLGAGSALVAGQIPGVRGYVLSELAERVDVRIDTLRHWLHSGHFTPSRPGGAFTAVDVVRLEVLARLVRSGVPVARAAELVGATE